MKYLQSLGIGKFVPGQNVYVIKSENKTIGKCTKCNGKGDLFTTIDSVEYKAKCPDCTYGRIEEKEYSIFSGVVSSVYFSLEAKRDDYNYPKHTKEINLYGEGGWTYNARSIYVRVDALRDTDSYSESNIFATKEEAEQEVEKRKANDITVPKGW